MSSSPAAVRGSDAAAEGAREHRQGVFYGVAAYLMWGLFPVYWVLLEPAGAVEILAHRIAWTMVVVLAILWLAGRRGERGQPVLRAVLRDRRRLALLAAAAVFITINWGTFIWGVNNGHVVETSLGYFINPLVSVLFGVLLAGGVVTAVPLLAFGAAANRVPLSLLGLLQYLAPVLQFATGVLVFGEQMP